MSNHPVSTGKAFDRNKEPYVPLSERQRQEINSLKTQLSIYRVATDLKNELIQKQRETIAMQSDKITELKKKLLQGGEA